MIDYCLKHTDAAEFDAIMLSIGLCVENDKEVVPCDYTILVDRIGPITMGETHYPEYYVNLRVLGELTEEQIATLDKFAINPSDPQYRTWL